MSPSAPEVPPAVPHDDSTAPYLFYFIFTVRRLRFCRSRRQLQVSGFIITGSRFRVKLELSYVAALLGSEEVGLVVVRESGIRKWVGRDGKLIEKGWSETCGVLMGGLRARGEGQAWKGRRPKQVKTLRYLIDDGKKSVSRVQVVPQAGGVKSWGRKIYSWMSHVAEFWQMFRPWINF